MNNLTILSGTSNPAFAEKICTHLGVISGEIYHHMFPSKETYCQIKSNIRGNDVFIVQGAGGIGGANDNLMQLLIMADAVRRSSANRITAVMPMSFYSRQDRKDKSRTPISAKLVANLLVASGVNRILTMDLHAPQIQGFFDIPVDCLEFQPVLNNHIKENFHSLALRDSCVVVAPDVGAVKRAESYAKVLNSGLALIVKLRKSDTEVDIESFVGDVKDKHCLLIDDLTESAGTLIQAAKACKERGAKSVTCAVTHFCITETGMSRLTYAMPNPNSTEIPYIDEFIHSDTATGWWNLKYKPANIREVSVSHLFARAIQNIHENKSISELFN
jgi:ribose-phosphate pyrophosphokinase